MEYFELRHPRIVKRIGSRVVDVQGNTVKLSPAEFESMYAPVADDVVNRVLGNMFKADCSEYQHALSMHDELHTSSISTFRFGMRALVIVVKLLFLYRRLTVKLCQQFIGIACLIAVRNGHSLNRLIMEDTREHWKDIPDPDAETESADALH